MKRTEMKAQKNEEEYISLITIGKQLDIILDALKVVVAEFDEMKHREIKRRRSGSVNTERQHSRHAQSKAR